MKLQEEREVVRMRKALERLALEVGEIKDLIWWTTCGGVGLILGALILWVIWLFEMR